MNLRCQTRLAENVGTPESSWFLLLVLLLISSHSRFPLLDFYVDLKLLQVLSTGPDLLNHILLQCWQRRQSLSFFITFAN